MSDEMIAEVEETQVEETEAVQGQEVEEVETQGGDTPPETPEQRLERIEREREADQKKINRQRKALSEADRERAELRQRIQEFEAKQSEVKQDQRPKEEDFETWDEFKAADEKYIRNQTRLEVQRELLQSQYQAEQARTEQERKQKFDREIAEFSVVNPDFKEAAQEFDAYAKSAKIQPDVMSAIVETAHEGNVALLINYFGENGGARLDELDEISKMSPTKAAVEIYKIQQKLTRPMAQKKQEPLPKPPERAKGSGKVNKGLGSHSSGDDVLKSLGLK